MKQVIYIGSDHAGFQLKERLKLMLVKVGYIVHDMGNAEYKQTDDYPDFAAAVAKKVVKTKTARGILCCRSGVGMSIAANKIPGVRAVLASNERLVKESIENNNVNILCLGQEYLNMKEVENIVKVFFKAKFNGEIRHKRRIKKIKELEKISQN